MAAPCEVDVAASGESDGQGRGFGSWLDRWLEVLGVDQAIYGAYILGVLQEEEEEEKLDALQGILCAFLEEDSLRNICKEIVERWSETQNVVTKVKKDEVQAITILIEKQAQIVVKPRVVSEEEKQRKAALLAQYADVTDEEDEADGKYDSGATMMNVSSDKSLFRNTNVEDVLKAQKLERDSLRDESQRKKEEDKLQKEKDKLAKQERKEKKKTQRRARK
ncbi:coiled-coil domain-containing protein 43-like [Marmota monax]|uniref:coiled-coil domain-containing protein 43-like n=1 Tax=Marmota monax TaxID=9995 RepID=UPI001EAFBBEB|nr:coiled-coil domain-containing protein 43-like [Marmota monax]XP_058440884.1 coiled-coil domain-containing protein 43-like [Marmota monax]